MARDLDPQIGNWYRGAIGMFEVVAWDEHTQTIEIQHYDGSVEELELESWDAMSIMPVSAPEDWSGPFDDLEPGELDEDETAVFPNDLINPLNRLEL